VISLVDLKAQYRHIKPEIDSAVLKVLESGQFVSGDETEALESEFAAYSGARYGIAVNSGTSSLHLALLAAGVGPGDEVITTPFTFVATAAAIRYTGATPCFVDIDPDSYTLNVQQLESAITKKTKAILPVHLYGQPANMDPITQLAKHHHLTVIEDAAQAHGAEYNQRRVGSIGYLGCFSFYPSKNLGAYGEGGIVVTNNADLAKKLRLLRNWGEERRYEHSLKGYNYRMDEMQAAILRVKLRYLDSWTEKRRHHAASYDRLLSGSDVTIPRAMSYARHVYHVYAIRTRQRDALRQSLLENGIQTGIHYPIPVHLQPAHADLGYGVGSFPVAESAAAEILSLPIYAELEKEQIEDVSRCVVRARNGDQAKSVQFRSKG